MYLFHGTDEEHYLKIKEEGFLPYTYFTPFLDSALCYGGPYIFAIWDETRTEYNNNWELRFDNHISADEICFCIKYTSEMMIFNQKVENNKRHKNEIICKNCNGNGALNYVNDGHHHLIGGGRFDDRNPYPSFYSDKIEICPVCEGNGTVIDIKNN
jgi:hypothetical protein